VESVKKRIVFSLYILMLLLGMEQCFAMDIRELTIKAAYLFRLSLFVDWPAEKLKPSGSDKIRFCISSGDKQITDTIKNILAGKTINQHEVEIVSIDLPMDLSACHLLYIPKNAEAETAMLQAVLNDPVLTVGESEEFFRQGGMVVLFNKKNSIRFAINNSAANRVGIKLRAQLLNLAEQYP